MIRISVLIKVNGIRHYYFIDLILPCFSHELLASRAYQLENNTPMSEQLLNPNRKIVERGTAIDTTNTQIHDHSVAKYYTSSVYKIQYFYGLVW
jgi:hypothetical protein